MAQYIYTVEDDKNCLINKNIYEITNYVNKFLEEHLEGEVKANGLEPVWITKDNNPIKILLWFFKWLAARQYSYFKVQMNPEYQKSNETKES